ncbi:restriction endonuclease subunit S [Listeria monocytogenes]|nr:restriction endonuclease subunit S [Listeria monocytogenes]EIB7756439.1 restriction endonuclease subunit S [Listeria monocytogenes]EIB7769657.1 restriction endonuclease subunit S [Listeria monocytogenes]EIB7778469.1 restriction endonuclease subunit S [Listeria monocytogenes]EIB7793253.1 restriction endonuclease subunit S [Listeria monocytogenes]
MRNFKKSVPVIRFKGFSEAWEQRKLGEDVNFLNGRAYSQKELLDKGKYKVLRVGNFNTNDRWYYSDLELEENKYANRGDLLYLWATNFGPEIWNQEKVIYHYHIWKLKIMNINVSKQYLYTWLITDKERIKQSTNGTTMVHVTKGHIEQREFQIPPNLTEQQKIGTFFKQLDDTIALHQRKLDALKQMKKGFLQQMFPKSEEDVPKIRFTDFNGNWRQRKLEEVADRVRGNDRRMELPTLTISASKGWLNQHERFFGNIAGKEQKNYTLLKKGQLSYNHGYSKSAKYGAVFVLRTYDEALVPRIYHSFKTNILANSDFIEYLFATKIPDRELRKIVSSGARMDGLLNINFNNFMSILIMLPFVEEQIKISNFLIRLDKIISLYQNKLDQLIKLKKAYLQYLFI